MNRKVTVTGANKVFFAFTISYLVFQVILGIIAVVVQMIQGPGSMEMFLNDNMYGMLLINQLVVILIPVLVYVLINRISFKEVFRVRKLSFLPALLITLMALPGQYAAAMLNTIVIYLLQFIGHIELPRIPVPQNLNELLVGILIIGVAPAICEEMLHRGVLLSAYERRGTFRAIFITAVFFGIFHFDITNFAGTAALGALFAYFVVRTNSIFAGVLAHFLNNAIAEVMQYLYRDIAPREGPVTILPQELMGSIVLGIISIAILTGLIAAFRHVTRKTAVYNPPISSVKQDITSTISHWPILTIFILYVLMGGFTLVSYVLMKFFPS